MRNFKKGYTILEILIVLSVLAVLLAVFLPSFSKIRENQVLKNAASEVFSAIDKARSQGLSSYNSSEYGVHFEDHKIVIFQGTVYSPTDSNNEKILITSPAYISSVNLTGGAVDIYFDRLSGAPSKTGTITVSTPSASKTITVSDTGTASAN